MEKIGGELNTFHRMIVKGRNIWRIGKQESYYSQDIKISRMKHMFYSNFFIHSEPQIKINL
ncbi:MAG: hypothetical protein J7L58_03910 [Thermoplasmata archaeon]|nr:hypothetical protein [Thermoplasmata archaeon]